MNNKQKIVIIGSGPAGLTAAIYTARAGLQPLVLAGTQVGGQLMTTTVIENFPGFPEGIPGPQLMQNMIKQAQNFGAEVRYSTVAKVDFSDAKKITLDNGEEIETDAVILASGSNARKLDIPGEAKFWGKGVSTCATCDGAFYREKTVAMVGGGDSAMEEATFLSRFASKVYIVHRREEFRASKIMQDRVLANPKIEVIWNSEVKEVLGEEVVTGLKIHNVKSDETTELEVDGMFLAIGHLPNTAYLNNAVELDAEGYIVTKDGTSTSVNGIFVAGDVRDHKYRQAITASGMGCMAAMDTIKWLEAKGE